MPSRMATGKSCDFSCCLNSCGRQVKQGWEEGICSLLSWWIRSAQGKQPKPISGFYWIRDGWCTTPGQVITSWNPYDRIRKENQWKVRWAIPVHLGNYSNLKAITGAVIYGYLHKDFHRKFRRKKSVSVKGDTSNFHPSSFSGRTQTAPVSVYGAANLFDISVSTASRLKHAAEKENYLKVKKNYGESFVDKRSMMKSLDYNDRKMNIVFHKGKYRFQLIDTVFPLFLFIRRQKLKP